MSAEGGADLRFMLDRVSDARRIRVMNAARCDMVGARANMADVIRRACAGTRARWAGVTLVEAGHVEVLAGMGGIDSVEQIPLSEAFCSHAVALSHPLEIGDARRDPLFRTSSLVRALDVTAYLGVPILTQTGIALGTVCVFDDKPRKWTEADVQVLADCAAAIRGRYDEVAEAHRRDFISGVVSPAPRALAAKWFESREPYDVPAITAASEAAFFDEDRGILGEFPDAVPGPCAIRRTGRRLVHALDDARLSPDALGAAITDGMVRAYVQCAVSGQPSYERLSIRFGSDSVTVERLLLPFRKPGVEYNTHVIGWVDISGVAR